MNWPLFDSRSINKESLEVRLSQLAELRNCIRQSRSIDEVTRKDGEAAILWFQQVVHKPLPTDATYSIV